MAGHGRCPLLVMQTARQHLRQHCYQPIHRQRSEAFSCVTPDLEMSALPSPVNSRLEDDVCWNSIGLCVDLCLNGQSSVGLCFCLFLRVLLIHSYFLIKWEGLTVWKVVVKQKDHVSCIFCPWQNLRICHTAGLALFSDSLAFEVITCRLIPVCKFSLPWNFSFVL